MNGKYEHEFDIRVSVFSNEENFEFMQPYEIRRAILERVLEVLSYNDVVKAVVYRTRWEQREDD